MRTAIVVCAGLFAIGAAAAQPITKDTTVAQVIGACDSQDAATRREKCDRVFAGTLAGHCLQKQAAWQDTI